MIIGYSRVSKAFDQDSSLQTKALKESGVEKFYEETASGGRWNRPQLQAMLGQLRKDDIIVVWKLDRLSRSLKDLLHIMETLKEKGAGFKSITEAIDTTSPAGVMFMQIIGSFAEFERAMIRERTNAGLSIAKSEGRIGGRKFKLDSLQKKEAIEMLTNEKKAASHIARVFKVSPSTISRLIQMQNNSL